MTRRACLLVVLILLLVGRSEPAAADAGLEEYRQALRAALADLERSGEAAAHSVAARLRTIGPVTAADGSTIQPNLTSILSALEAERPNPQAAAAGLQAVLAEVERPQPTPQLAAGDDARTRLQRILDRPEFQPAPPPDPISAALQQWWQTIQDRIGSALRAVFDWLAQREGGSPSDEFLGGALRFSLALAGLLLIGGILALVLRGLGQTIGPGVIGSPAEPGAPPPSADAWRAEADRLAQTGAFRAAIRALYLAALLRWDEQGRLRFDRTLTNREVLRQATSRGDAPLVERLGPLVERFDRLWYSGLPGSPEDYADFARLAGRAWEPS